MALSPFGVSLVAGFNNAAIWIRIWIIVSMAGFAVLAGFGCQRVSVYFMRDATGYFSPLYTTPPNSINDVIPHVACGFATFLMVPVLVITYIVAGLAPLRLPACLLFLGVAVATVGTIAGIPSQLSALAGVGVVILAGLWAVWWGITGVMSAVYAFKKNQERFQEWFFRSVFPAYFTGSFRSHRFLPSILSSAPEVCVNLPADLPLPHVGCNANT